MNKNNNRAASSHGAVHIRSLKVFYDVVRRRSFSQAASDHGMTQSAASQSVQHLEDFLSVQLTADDCVAAVDVGSHVFEACLCELFTQRLDW